MSLSLEDTFAPRRVQRLLDYFSRIEDTRQPFRVAYPMAEVLRLAVCGTIADCDDYEAIADWGEENLGFLREFLPYHHGVPTGRWLTIVINRINPALFSACFAAWVRETWPDRPELIAIDGKTSRRSHDRSQDLPPLHLAQTFANDRCLPAGLKPLPHRGWDAGRNYGRWAAPGQYGGVCNRIWVIAMPTVDDLSHSLTALDQDSTLLVVVEMSKSSWLVAGMASGIERSPLKQIDPDPATLHKLVLRWREEAAKRGRKIERTALAFEAGRDGFWLARWLRQRDIEAYVIHSTSVAVTREQRRAKTDRLDTAMLMRVFLGWLRGERGHCRMVAVPNLEEEDAKRPSRERENLVGEQTRIINRMKGALARLGIRNFKPERQRALSELPALLTPEGGRLPANLLEEMQREMARLAVIREQIAAVEQARLARLNQARPTRSNTMVALLARVVGVGVETADMLVQEVLSRNLRDRHAVARYAGLTGSPDESGSRRREKGLAKAGNARVRRGLIQLAWRFLMFQKGSSLAQWYRTRTAQGARKTTMIVALARKLLIAFWRMVTVGEIPAGVILRPKREQLRTPKETCRIRRTVTLRDVLSILIRGGSDPSYALAATP